MAKTSTEVFDNKVSLIYEYNKKSPLFVRMANTELENNNVERSIAILEQGIKHFPDFAAAHLLLGKALTLLGNYSKALKAVRKGCDLLHSSRTYEYYLKEIENIKKQRSLFQTTRRAAFFNEEEFKEDTEPDLFETQKPADKTVTKESSKKSGSIDDRLGQLAREISTAKIPEPAGDISIPLVSSDEPFSGGTMIVSETLAKIYVAQGEYREAIDVYNKLKKKNPQKTGYYNDKIKELNQEL